MFFVLYLNLISGLCRAIFPVYLVSPIGLPVGEISVYLPKTKKFGCVGGET